MVGHNGAVVVGSKLATLMPRMGQQQVDQIQARHVFVEHVRDTMVANRRLARSMNVEIYLRRLETFRVTKTISCRPGIPTRSYGVDLRNRWCECRRFETLHYPSAHVVAACAKVNLDAEQYVDDVYTLERTLRIWENEFPVLPNLSTWEVPPMTFELLPDRGLRRNPRGRPQSSRIRNKMDIREKSEGKHCGIYRIDRYNIARMAEPQLYDLAVDKSANRGKYIKCTLSPFASGMSTAPTICMMYARAAHINSPSVAFADNCPILAFNHVNFMPEKYDSPSPGESPRS
ncbi:hypothetical protein GOBAR_DD05327 [Gossypium barbadense]|nr:hypothetical protein GOBAR_DD05327 [Gossypium barbadense]